MSDKKFPAMLVVLLACCLVLPLPAQQDAASAIRQADADFCRATREKGLEGWVSYFSEDAVLSQFKPPALGKDGIRKAYEKFFQQRDLDFQWAPDRAEVFPAGTLGYTTGRYTLAYMDDSGKHARQTGNYLTVWQQQKDGSWKVIADFGTRDREKSPAQ